MGKATKSTTTESGKAHGKLRIIGGQWRGRKLDFPALPGLRPTPDRVRETVFNWLAPHIVGSHCLDLCCGSGVLGLEACSRGAKQVILVDKAAAVQASITNNLSMLLKNHEQQQPKPVEFVLADSSDWLAKWHADHNARLSQNKHFDIVFYDPPYQDTRWADDVQTLLDIGLLTANGLLYAERPKTANTPIPSGWAIYRDKIAGANHYLLLRQASN